MLLNYWIRSRQITQRSRRVRLNWEVKSWQILMSKTILKRKIPMVIFQHLKPTLIRCSQYCQIWPQNWSLIKLKKSYKPWSFPNHQRNQPLTHKWKRRCQGCQIWKNYLIHRGSQHRMWRVLTLTSLFRITQWIKANIWANLWHNQIMSKNIQTDLKFNQQKPWIKWCQQTHRLSTHTKEVINKEKLPFHT